MPGKRYTCLRIAVALLPLIITTRLSYAQGVGVNAVGQPPFHGAILDVASSDKGVLLPRTDTAGIMYPAEGLIIFDTTDQVFRYYSGSVWHTLLTEGSHQFWWPDQDDDGYGGVFCAVYAPSPPEFYVGNNDDCNDSDANVHPGAVEVCDGIDNDCDGSVDEFDPMLGQVCGTETGPCVAGVYICVAGVLVCDGEIPPSPEICDGVDNDCNGLVDDNLTPPGGCYICMGHEGWQLYLLDYCFINGLCVPEGQNPENPCQYCVPFIDPFAWIENCPGQQICCEEMCVDTSTNPNHCGGCGISCDDGNPCTQDICENGECVHIYLPEGESCPGGTCDGLGNCVP